MYHPFSIAETLKTAWNILKKNFITIIVYSVSAFFIISILTFTVSFFIAPESFYSEMLVSLLILFVQAYTTLGLYKLIFTLIDSEFYEFEFSQIVPKIKMIFSYLIVVFLLAACMVTFKIVLDKFLLNEVVQTIIIWVGIAAGMYAALRIMFFNTFIVDDDSGPVESLKQSFNLTKGYMTQVVTILLIILLLIAIPAYLSKYFPLTSLFIIFSYPFVNIILIVTYRKLIYSHQDIDEIASEVI
jgi:hypothetical protein